MAKNPFKKKSLTDTLVNVGIGGAANVAIDAAWDAIGVDSYLPAMESVSASTIKHAIKIIGGALVGGMVSNRYARAAADGVATVGVSNLIDELWNPGSSDSSASASESAAASAGLPGGTIGALRGYRYGNKSFGKGKGRMAGLEDFQS